MSFAWREMHCESYIISWSIHDAWSGKWRGVKVGSMGLVYLMYRGAAMCVSFGDYIASCPSPLVAPPIMRECGRVLGS